MSNKQAHLPLDIINLSTSASRCSHNMSIVRYTAGLKALLDVMPENTEHYSTETIDNYLWVIDELLSGICQKFESSTNIHKSR